MTDLPLAGMLGLGFPELMAITVLVIVIIIVARMLRGRGGNAVTRICAACGRSLEQPPGAAFCAFCGKRLP